MLETLIEYQICSNMLNELTGLLTQLNAMKRKDPHNLSIAAQFNKVLHDTQVCHQIVENYRPVILTHLEVKHKVRFDFLTQVATASPVTPEIVKL